ncbi:rod-binding protein [Ruegeria sp. HKCCA5426]|uniref:rod-binding protein n=1 Tax=Ruegeria sp. HKCCA5426 TaxID=2682985 RepID=UPI0020C38A3F|nr:rod-binding protein [Ruegeria sp. HKCCA5426]
MKVSVPVSQPMPPSSVERLKTAAVELEATFLAEMLKSAGLGKGRQSFGGGAGEDQFSTLLVQQQAHQLAKAGGVGLQDVLFQSLMEKADAE